MLKRESTEAWRDSRTQMAGKTGLWILMLTIIILFGTLTLAFLVSARKGVELDLPWIFYGNTIFLLISSLMIHRSMQSEGEIRRRQMMISLGMGLLFLIGQAFAWFLLIQSGMYFTGSGREASYVYLLSGLHGLHILAGLAFMLYVYQKRAFGHRLEMAVFFWHFLGILWLFLLMILSMP
ncbi:MAG: cytochrome c oxidase subunit 3 [Bacteroidota bacterium]